MGLTIHYQLRLSASVSAAAAETLVRTAHRRATAITVAEIVATLCSLGRARPGDNPDTYLR